MSFTLCSYVTTVADNGKPQPTKPLLFICVSLALVEWLSGLSKHGMPGTLSYYLVLPKIQHFFWEILEIAIPQIQISRCSEGISPHGKNTPLPQDTRQSCLSPMQPFTSKQILKELVKKNKERLTCAFFFKPNILELDLLYG